VFRVPPSLLSLALAVLCLSAQVGGQGILATLSTDLLVLLLRGDDRPVRAIIRGDVSAIQLAAARDGLPVLKVLDGFVVIAAPPSALSVLRGVPGIASLSRDLPVAPAMTVSDRAMAADQARLAAGGLLGIGGLPAVDGSGVGVAVVDSGISPHSALAGKVVASVSFVSGDADTRDGFGHGTHIAGIIAGAASSVTPLYRAGVAPGAHLVNVRVLGNEGVGYTSDVIAGIQWVIANRSRYGVRVVNLSLGHPSVEPCLTDPLCFVVGKAAAAGLVVVASAGNSGRNAEGQQVLGSITTPGTSPSAITVGALNTWGTVARDDDTVASYSSRGPTKYELGLKPDVVAPGNKIVSLEAAGSYLAARYPAQHVAGGGMNGYFLMSGTSMAAAMVSGGVALLLDGLPTLTVRQIKVALQLSASFMPKEGLVAAGTGSVNLWAARRVNGALQSLTGIPTVTVAGRTVRPGNLLVSDSGSLVDRAYGRVGLRLMGALEMLQGWTSPGGPASRVSLFGLLNPLASMPPARMVWGELTTLVGGNQLVWSEQLLSPVGQQLVWSEHVLQSTGQQLVWSEMLTAGQQLVWSETGLPISGQQLVWSEQLFNASAQQLVWSEHGLTSGYQLVWSESGWTEGYQLVWSEQRTAGQQLVWSEAQPEGGQ
jgi:serine protease AprX